jgi:hypothetical protein
MATLKQYNSDPMHENIRGFEMELKKKFPDLVVTSGFRPRAFTKQGNVSRHAKGEAIDIEPRQDVYDFLWNTEEGISLMYKYGVGMLDERSKEMLEKTGGSGAHLHLGLDSTLVPKMQQRYAELKNMNSKETFLSDSQQLPNFAYNQTASVMLPDYATLPEPIEEKKQEEGQKSSAESKLEEKQKEQDFLDYFKQNKEQLAQLYPTEQEQPRAEAPQLTALDYYNQANQILSAQQGGVITDNRGQWAHPGKVTRITSPNITMQNVNYPVLGISEQTGEQKLMMPNLDYFFDKTKSVVEYPLMQEGGQWVEIDRGNGKIERINTDSAEYRELYNQKLIGNYIGNGEVLLPELNEVTVTGFRRTNPESLEQLPTPNEESLKAGKIDTSNFALFNEYEGVKKDGIPSLKPNIIADVDKESLKNTPNVEEIKDLTKTYKSEKELQEEEINKLIKERTNLFNTRSNELDPVEELEDTIDVSKIKTTEDIIKVQQRLKSLGYNLNPKGIFANEGVDGKIGKVTKQAIENYNKTKEKGLYISYKDKTGYLGSCKEGQCSEYAQNEVFRNLKPNIPRDKWNEVVGTRGDAWTIGDNIVKAGGQKVESSKLKPGDFVTMYTGGGSPYLGEAKKHGTDATHIGVVDKVNLDGSYYILHNVHSADYLGMITGGDKWKGREFRNLVKDGTIVDETNKGFQVRNAYRPNYEAAKSFEKKTQVRDDVSLTLRKDKAKEFLSLNEGNRVGKGVEENLQVMIKPLNSYEVKKTMANKHGLTETDYQSLSKLALGILAQETKFGTSDKALIKEPIAKAASFIGLKDDEASQGAAQIKYETNYGNSDLTEFGINKENFKEDDKTPIVVVDRLATYYKQLKKQGLSDKDAMYKAVEKYNRGRNTKYSDVKDSDYVNKVLNFSEFFDVKDTEGKVYNTKADALLLEKNVAKKKIVASK